MLVSAEIPHWRGRLSNESPKISLISPEMIGDTKTNSLTHLFLLFITQILAYQHTPHQSNFYIEFFSTTHFLLLVTTHHFFIYIQILWVKQQHFWMIAIIIRVAQYLDLWLKNEKARLTVCLSILMMTPELNIFALIKKNERTKNR